MSFLWYRVDDGFNFLIGLRIYEQAIADVEKAIVEALEKQYADVLAPLKENLTPKKFGLKYVQKLSNVPKDAYSSISHPKILIFLNFFYFSGLCGVYILHSGIVHSMCSIRVLR